MPRQVSGVSFGEAKARSTAWAVTFGDMVTLLLTFFILVIVMMNEAEKHIDRIINMLLDETYTELNSALPSDMIKVDRVTKGVKITMAEIRTEGHTDNVPLPTELITKWESNWELSTARALNVVELISEFSALSQDKFSAMGYGEYRPRHTNDSPGGRARNRRVEIYIDAFVTNTPPME